MKKLKLFIIVCISLFSLSLSAQETNKEKLVIPLSNLDKPGFLEVSGIYCSIFITGYGGSEVIIEANIKSKIAEITDTKNGMKKINASSMSVEAEERDNRIEVSGGLNKNGIVYNIKVPHNFSMELSTVNNGEIKVENVNGEINVDNVNGPITILNVSGLVSASTINEDIIVKFDKVTNNMPMAFSSLNGDIDVTFPDNIKADIKMQNTQGDIFTDFDVEIGKDRKINNEKNNKGVYKVSIDEWIHGKINGGGPEYSFKNFNGDIIIRKK